MGRRGAVLKSAPRSQLEAELRAELTRERPRHNHAARSDKSDRLRKCRTGDLAVVVVAVIGPVGYIEGLEENVERGPFAEPDHLAGAHVELEECLAAKV